jgi:hypothetical protein
MTSRAKYYNTEHQSAESEVKHFITASRWCEGKDVECEALPLETDVSCDIWQGGNIHVLPNI